MELLILPWNLANGSVLNIVPTLVLSVIVSYCVCVATYRLFFSPLSSFPGPWYAAISDLWHLSHVLRLRRCRGIDDLFKKYGPIVRIAPNMVAFLDVNSMKVVYGTSSRLSKTTQYKSFVTNDHDHSFTTLDHSAHVIRKKAYAAHYTPANLVTFWPELQDLAVSFISALNSTASSADAVPAVDTLELLRNLLIDINFIHIFSENPGMITAWKEKTVRGGANNFLSDAITDFPKRGLLKGTLHPWLWNLVAKMPNARWQNFCASDALIAEVVTAKLEKRREALRRGKSDLSEIDESSMLTRLLQHHYPSGEAMPDADIVSECAAHIIAGTDTTSTTISYILWEISRRRDIAVRLQSELDVFLPDGHKLPDMQVIQNLPYLTAVMKEGLRVYSAVPSLLERNAHGSATKPFSLMGYTIPDGTIIGSQAWSNHRLSSVYPCPDIFLPDRWLLAGVSSNSLLTHRSSSSNAAPQTPTKSSRTHVSSADLNSSLLTPGHDAFASMPSSPVNSVFSVTSTPMSIMEKGLKGSNLLSIQNEMQAHFFPFGTGSRICGGQNVALLVIRMVVAAIVRNFDIVSAPETNEDTMRICDSFVIFPKALKCKLIFIPREH